MVYLQTVAGVRVKLGYSSNMQAAKAKLANQDVLTEQLLRDSLLQLDCTAGCWNTEWSNAAKADSSR